MILVLFSVETLMWTTILKPIRYKHRLYVVLYPSLIFTRSQML